MSEFKPMLASPADLDTLRYPLLASPKLDGIRAIVMNGMLVSRKLLPIPNKHVQALFGRYEFEGLDGELIVGSPTADDVYRCTTSIVMSQDKPASDVGFFIFDSLKPALARYDMRMDRAMQTIERAKHPHMTWHMQQMLGRRDDLDEYESRCVNEGYEGIITRDPRGMYKHGRSTAKEQIMLKVKRFEDSEAEVIAIEEEMFNGNAATRDNLGRTKRSSAKAGKVGKGTMGALVCRDLKTGVVFNIGSGFTAADRELTDWVGQIVTYKFFPVGVKDKPRHPVYKGRRSKIDL